MRFFPFRRPILTSILPRFFPPNVTMFIEARQFSFSVIRQPDHCLCVHFPAGIRLQCSNLVFGVVTSSFLSCVSVHVVTELASP